MWAPQNSNLLYYILFQERVNRTWTVQNKIKETNSKTKKKKPLHYSLSLSASTLTIVTDFSKIVFTKHWQKNRAYSFSFSFSLSFTQKRCRFLLRWWFLILSGALSTTFEGLKISPWWVYLISLFYFKSCFSFSWKCFLFSFSIPGDFCCNS